MITSDTLILLGIAIPFHILIYKKIYDKHKKAKAVIASAVAILLSFVLLNMFFDVALVHGVIEFVCILLLPHILYLAIAPAINWLSKNFNGIIYYTLSIAWVAIGLVLTVISARSTYATLSFYIANISHGVQKVSSIKYQNFEDCLMQNIKEAKTDEAVKIVRQFCRKEIEQQNKNRSFKIANEDTIKIGTSSTLKHGFCLNGSECQAKYTSPILSLKNDTAYHLTKIVVNINGDIYHADVDIPPYNSRDVFSINLAKPLNTKASENSWGLLEAYGFTE